MRPSFDIVAVEEVVILLLVVVRRKDSTSILKKLSSYDGDVSLPVSTCGVTDSMTCQWVALIDIENAFGDSPETRSACQMWVFECIFARIADIIAAISWIVPQVLCRSIGVATTITYSFTQLSALFWQKSLLLPTDYPR
jgi:hypothetical protein